MISLTVVSVSIFVIFGADCTPRQSLEVEELFERRLFLRLDGADAGLDARLKYTL